MAALPVRPVYSISAFLLLFFLVFPLRPLLAADANPQLVAHAQGVRDAAARRPLRVDSLDLRIRIHGAIAETVLTARFGNPGGEILEGDFTLALPAGSVVTGYALDVGERMVDGVLVDQRQARLAYELRVRAGIDPGLAEVGRDNLFRTRVFPILPGSGRTIRLRFTTPFDPKRGYVLPLSDGATIGRFSLGIAATGLAAAPRITLPDGVSARLLSGDDGHRLAFEGDAVRLDGAIAIAAVPPAAPLLLSERDGQGRFFQIVGSAPAAALPDRGARSVALLWDRSLSRADDALAGEIGLVRAYLERVRPETIELILFDSGGVERIRVADAAAAAERLGAVRYRGGTSLAVLAGQDLGDAEACLLFTDGLVTIDRRDGFRPGCPLFAISSARDADRAWLGSLARGTGGEAIDLSSRTVEEAAARLTRRVPRILDVRTAGGAAVDFALLDGGPLGWRIVGPMPAAGDVVVRLAGLGPGVTERVYSATAQPVADMAGAAALWAADRIGVRAAGDDTDQAGLIAFSRLYSVASPGISFVVLETAADYANAAIEPPPGFAKDQREIYDTLRRDIELGEKRAKDERLAHVLGQWEEQRAWWGRRFDPYAKPPRPRNDQARERRGVPEPVVAPSAPPPPAEPMPVPQGAQADRAETLETYLDRLPQANPSGGSAGAEEPSAIVTLAPWAPNRPYLAALDAAAPVQFERVFAEQQAKHGGLPAFWLDVAEWQFRKGRRADALAALLSSLDLPTRNSQTLSIVADRLIRYGELDRAIYLLERLVAAEADRPQPRRTLALALAKRAENGSADQRRADLARAISLLTEVVMTPWPGAYDGVEMISLMEVNRLIPLYRAAGGDGVALDPRLVALLDVDLRVVIEWNSELTDIDLWVDEPNGERAIYSNPRTTIGGRLSNDMTAGFGPEEYLLRRAPAGTFTVRAHVFAADRLNPNGASNVTARLIRDYGRPNQSEEVVDIELLPEAQSRERLIGRIVFRR